MLDNRSYRLALGLSLVSKFSRSGHLLIQAYLVFEPLLRSSVLRLLSLRLSAAPVLRFKNKMLFAVLLQKKEQNKFAEFAVCHFM